MLTIVPIGFWKSGCWDSQTHIVFHVWFFMVMPGGTSMSTPLFAAITALKEEQGGKQYGFPNPLCYSNPHVFRGDVEQPPFKIAHLSATKHTYYASSRDISLVITPTYENATRPGSPAPKFLQRR